MKRADLANNIDQILEDLFKVNEGHKLYSKSLAELGKANKSEVKYMEKTKL